ncbi:MAG: protein-L-isoaspartate O-methyltransferase [Candidatus Micrarchaeota archaeon]|nr:protein-L-isoaspartate O-methyltransferase [Candidatus Micrarchaeota archaeon]
MDEAELNSMNERLIGSLIARGFLRTPTIIEAFRRYPRHNFVPRGEFDSAYLDMAIKTVGFSTISQPSVIASILEELSPQEGEKVLEVGTGSGWQSALISHCVGESGRLITMEINREVFEFARKNLAKFSIRNIKMLNASGMEGYPNGAPYDKIVFAAATQTLPDNALKQLKKNGKLIAPIGSVDVQRITVVTKNGLGEYDTRYTDTVVFVPLTGGGDSD